MFCFFLKKLWNITFVFSFFHFTFLSNVIKWPIILLHLRLF